MKKSLKKQAVFPVLMLLVVTALALIGSSFAWFSMANTAKVNEITGTIEKSSVGLMISQDATTYKGTITLGSGETPLTYVKPTVFRQVSTKDGINFFGATIVEKNPDGTAKLIYSTADSSVNYASGVAQGVSTSNPAQYAAAGVASNASYMVFDLFFRVEYDSTLYLDFGTGFTANVTGANNSYENKAMRVAFLDYGYTTSSAASSAQALDTLEENGTVIWDPAGDASYFGVKKASTDEHDTFAPYVNTGDAANFVDSVPTVFGTSIIPTAALNDESTLPTRSIASLTAGVNKLRVVVWLEGNDLTCTSSVAELQIRFNLNFYARKVTS